MSGVPVTDHAVLRYLERAWGVDVEGLRRRIARIARTGIEAEGASALMTGGLRFVLSDGAVVTIVPIKRGRRRRGRRGG